MATSNKRDLDIVFRDIEDSEEKPINFFTSRDECDSIISYLLNPAGNGTWVLKFSFLKDKGISEYILKQLTEAKNDKKKVKEKDYLYEYYISDKKLINSLTNTLSNILYIFKHAYEGSSNKKKNKELEKHIVTSHKRIFEYLDFEKIKADYPKAYKIFSDKIYYKDFYPAVHTELLQKIKNSNFLLTDNDDTNDGIRIFSLISTDKHGLQAFVEFLKELGKIDSYSLTPLFSPEEKIYANYFYILEGVYKVLIGEENIQILIKKSIDEYRDKNYPYSISNIGLIAEEYLTIIYETIFREQVPKKMTLMQVYEKIVFQVRECYDSQTPGHTSSSIKINDLYREIEENLSRDPIPEKNSFLISRKILQYIQEDRKRLYNYIKDSRVDSRTTIFPKYIRDNITELINYRNSISHKTKIPIGYFEALRAMYCCITLIMWWLNTLKEIDWDLSKEEIIKSLVEINMSNNISNQELKL